MAITGKKRGVSKEYILSKIDEGDIYSFYLPKLVFNKRMLSPFRKEENASFVVWWRNKTYSHKDFGDERYKGRAFELVMQLFSLTYPQSLEKIASDFGLTDCQSAEYKRIISENKGIKEEKPPVIIQVKAKKFGTPHEKYLSEFHISPTSRFLFSDTKVVAVSQWAVNRLKMPLGGKEIAFAYVLSKEGKEYVKIYRPHAPKKEKWTSNIPFNFLHGLDNLKDCETGVITKGVKDAMLIWEHITKNVCCVQAEDPAAISQETIDYINANCKRVFVNFDGDAKGVASCQKITKQTGWGYINPPKKLLEQGITDFCDMSKALGIQAVIDFFKEKGVII